MKALASDWYKKIWTLSIQDMSWVEDTERQVDFLIDKLEMHGNEKVLDLACGFGRHACIGLLCGFLRCTCIGSSHSADGMFPKTMKC